MGTLPRRFHATARPRRDAADEWIACLTSKRSPVRAGHRPYSRVRFGSGGAATALTGGQVPKDAVEASWKRLRCLAPSEACYHCVPTRPWVLAVRHRSGWPPTALRAHEPGPDSSVWVTPKSRRSPHRQAGLLWRAMARRSLVNVRLPQSPRYLLTLTVNTDALSLFVYPRAAVEKVGCHGADRDALWAHSARAGRIALGTTGVIVRRVKVCIGRPRPRAMRRPWAVLGQAERQHGLHARVGGEPRRGARHVQAGGPGRRAATAQSPRASSAADALPRLLSAASRRAPMPRSRLRSASRPASQAV